MKKIKLIWDFRGYGAEQTAMHHSKHLNEYLENKNYIIKNTGYHTVNDMYALAFVVVFQEDLIAFRDALKPHRAEYYTD